MSQARLIQSRSDLKSVLLLALPVLGEQFLEFLVGMVDTWLAGNFLPPNRTVPAMAAIGLISYSIWMLFVIFSSVGIGATAVVARLFGAEQEDEANRAANQAVLLGLLASLVATFLLWQFSDAFVSLLQLEGDAHELASQYLRIVVPSVPAFMMISVGVACLHGAGDTVSGLVVMAVVNVLNASISAALTIGWGPLPELGWIGLAIGTAVSHVVGGMLIALLLARGRAGIRLTVENLRPDPRMMRRVLRIGLPAGLNEMMLLIFHLWYLGIINSMGTLSAAAHGLGVKMESPAYLAAWAFSISAASLTGQHLGALNPLRAKRATGISLLICGGLLTIYMLVLLAASAPMTRFFLPPSSEVMDMQATAILAANLLKIVALGFPFLALYAVINGALRGAGDTTWPLVVTLIGFLLVRIPGAYYLAWETIPIPFTGLEIEGMGWGITGAWISMVADQILRAILLGARYLSGKWQHVKV